MTSVKLLSNALKDESKKPKRSKNRLGSVSVRLRALLEVRFSRERRAMMGRKKWKRWRTTFGVLLARRASRVKALGIITSGRRSTSRLWLSNSRLLDPEKAAYLVGSLRKRMLEEDELFDSEAEIATPPVQLGEAPPDPDPSVTDPPPEEVLPTPAEPDDPEDWDAPRPKLGKKGKRKKKVVAELDDPPPIAELELDSSAPASAIKFTPTISDESQASEAAEREESAESPSVPQISKRDKRRAKEAAKKAADPTVSQAIEVRSGPFELPKAAQPRRGTHSAMSVPSRSAQRRSSSSTLATRDMRSLQRLLAKG